MRKVVKILFSGALLATALAVGGCGGGSSSDDLDDGVDYSGSPLGISAGSDRNNADGIGDSDIQLFWEQKRKYDFYRILINPDGHSGFTKIGDDIPIENPDEAADEDLRIFLTRLVGEDLKYKIITFLFKWPDAVFMLMGCKGEPGNAECEQVGQQSSKGLSGGVIDWLTTKIPDSNFTTTYGISVDISENALIAAVGANTASLFECTESEIIEIEDEAVENCEKQVLPECEDIPEDEELPEECPDPDALVYKVIPNAGAVYMYTRDTAFSDWQLAQAVQTPNAGENDNFGWSVTLSEDGAILVATAPGEDSSERSKPKNNSAESSGAAYVFRQAGDEWEFVSYLKASNGVQNDLFGWTATVSGNGSVIAVGANQRASCEGAVYTFEPNDNDVWVQTDFLRAPARKSNDVFGSSVSLDYKGATLAVGATQFPAVGLTPGCVFIENPTVDAGTGIVHLFERDGTIWDHVVGVTAENADKADRFGWAISLNSNAADNGRANRLLVGAPTESGGASRVNGPAGNDKVRVASGAAYLFEKRGGQWEQTQYLKASNAGPTDQFGNSVSLTSSGSIIAVGAWGEAGTGTGINPIGEFDFARNSGAAYIFKEDATPGLWTEVAYVKAPFVSSFSNFGWSLATSEKRKALIVGAPGFRGGGSVPGNVYIY